MMCSYSGLHLWVIVTQIGTSILLFGKEVSTITAFGLEGKFN